MVAFVVVLIVFIMTVLATIVIGRIFEKRFTIESFPYFMRCMTVLITIPFNTLISMYAFVFLFCLLLYPGYLKVFYYSAISWLVYMIMLQIERSVVGNLAFILWKNDKRSDATETIEHCSDEE